MATNEFNAPGTGPYKDVILSHLKTVDSALITELNDVCKQSDIPMFDVRLFIHSISDLDLNAQVKATKEVVMGESTSYPTTRYSINKDVEA